MISTNRVSDDELKIHFCFETSDLVALDPEVTDFKQRARLHQASWREKRGLKIGTQPMRPKPEKEFRPVGSRIDIEVAYNTGANFINEQIHRAVQNRIRHPQPHQMLNVDRLYCDLLSSMPMCFNLFGCLQADIEFADQAVHKWWPDVPGRVCAIHFEWSPGRRLKGQYLENRTAFDAAIELDLNDGHRGILGIETKYHEHCRAEQKPNDKRFSRYKHVTAQSNVFSTNTLSEIVGKDLQQIWLDHILALSMLQHESGIWGWAGFVLVHPARNPSYARAVGRYRSLLKDPSSFRMNTIESLIEANVLPKELVLAFSERYFWQ